MCSFIKFVSILLSVLTIIFLLASYVDCNKSNEKLQIKIREERTFNHIWQYMLGGEKKKNKVQHIRRNIPPELKRTYKFYKKRKSYYKNHYHDRKKNKKCSRPHIRRTIANEPFIYGNNGEYLPQNNFINSKFIGEIPMSKNNFNDNQNTIRTYQIQQKNRGTNDIQYFHVNKQPISKDTSQHLETHNNAAYFYALQPPNYVTHPFKLPNHSLRFNSEQDAEASTQSHKASNNVIHYNTLQHSENAFHFLKAPDLSIDLNVQYKNNLNLTPNNTIQESTLNKIEQLGAERKFNKAVHLNITRTNISHIKKPFNELNVKRFSAKIPAGI